MKSISIKKCIILFDIKWKNVYINIDKAPAHLYVTESNLWLKPNKFLMYMSSLSKERHLRKTRDWVHRNDRCLDYPRFGAIKEVTSKSKWMHGAHPARIESHPAAAAFWLTASWHRGNTLPTDRGPTYVDTPTRGRVRAQCQPTTRATTPWTWTCAGLARLVAVQLESFAET